MKRSKSALLTAALGLCLATSSIAATWTKVGTSGLSTNPSTIQDWMRPVLNCVAVDDSGNVYATANNANNKGVPGGVTIYKSNGSRVDVDLNALGYPGGVTKMVKGGDGRIYALQNWVEAYEWVYNGGGATLANMRMYGTEGISNKILRINADGTVEKIYDALPYQDGWFVDVKGTQSIVDLGGGNRGIQVVDPDDAKYSQYYKQTRDPAYTLGARFKVSSYSTTSKIYLYQANAAYLDSAGLYGYSPAFAIAMRSDGNFWLMNLADGSTVQQLGPIVLDQWNEAYLHINGPAGQVKVCWNGTEYTVNITDTTKMWNYNIGWAQIGASTDASGVAGTSTVVFDWFGYARGYVKTKGTPIQWVSFNEGEDPWLDTDGTTVIWTGLPIQWNNRVQGMAVGPDGNIYFTVGGVHSYWKPRWFWRYNIGQNKIEPSGHHLANDGKNEAHVFTDLEYVGNNQFAVIFHGGGSTSDWRLDPMGWDATAARVTGGAVTGSTAVGWGRQFPTASAYDPIRKRAWVGGWNCAAGLTWSYDGTGKFASVTDLGSGNKGLTALKSADANWTAYTLVYTDAATGAKVPVKAYTSAARFKVDSYTGCNGVRFMTNVPWSMPKPPLYNADQWYGPRVQIGINNISGSDRFVLTNRKVDGTEIVLADIAPVVTGQFNEAYLFTESTIAGTERRVKCWWNGVKVCDQPIADSECNAGQDNSWLQFGAHTGSFSTVPAGTASVTFDWYSAGRGVIAPSDANKKWDYFADGSQHLHYRYELRGNVLTKYDGELWGAPGLLDSSNKVKVVANMQSNGYSMQVMDSPKPNGYYWVSTLAVNPVDGKAWMAWNAEKGYDIGDLGKVITRDSGMNLGDEGTPEPGAAVCGLAFANNKAYALTCNLTTGAYSLYAADQPLPGPQKVGKWKSYARGAYVQTDEAKIVTYPVDPAAVNYFYIQDEDQTGGIKVIVKETSLGKAKGDKVNVTGILDVVDNEAVVYAIDVSLASSGNADPRPAGMTVKNLGGDKNNLVPATIGGIGPNNIGLLTRITGKVTAFVFDDLANSYWFTVDDGSGAKTTYMSMATYQPTTVDGVKVQWNGAVGVGDVVSVTGVSALDYKSWDTFTYPVGQRRILPRGDYDIQIQYDAP